MKKARPKKLPSQFDKGFENGARAALDAIPTNWCDPLLTGPTAALPEGYRFAPSDIEKLLRGIRQRIERATDMKSAGTSK